MDTVIKTITSHSISSCRITLMRWRVALELNTSNVSCSSCCCYLKSFAVIPGNNTPIRFFRFCIVRVPERSTSSIWNAALISSCSPCTTEMRLFTAQRLSMNDDYSLMTCIYIPELSEHRPLHSFSLYRCGGVERSSEKQRLDLWCGERGQILLIFPNPILAPCYAKLQQHQQRHLR